MSICKPTYIKNTHAVGVEGNQVNRKKQEKSNTFYFARKERHKNKVTEKSNRVGCLSI